MSKRNRGMLDLLVEAALRPVAEVRADAAAKMVRDLKGSEHEANIARRGVGAGDFKSVHVYGVDTGGAAHQAIDVTFADDGSGKVLVDTPEGRCALGALSDTLPEMVAHQARAMEKKGLRAEVRYHFTDAIYADEARAEKKRGEYGIVPCAAPEWRKGYEPRELVRMQPGRDKGTMVRMTGSVRNKKR